MFFCDIVNLISLSASSIGFMILLSLAFKRPSLMKRVSLQLQTGIALLDITRHIQLHNLAIPENSFCTFIAFYGFFSDHLYVFLNVAIALNLHLFLLKRYRPRHYVIWIYFVVSAGISLLFNLVPLGNFFRKIVVNFYIGFGYLGKNPKSGCYLKSDIANRHIVKFFMVHILNWPGIIYCLIVSVIVISQYIFGKVKDIETDIIWLPEVRGLSFMISLNSLACFLTMFFYLLAGALFDWFGFNSSVLFSLSKFALRSTGTLNLICLLMDYQVWFAIIGCASPRKPPPSPNFELKNKRNNGQPSALSSRKKSVLDPTETYTMKYSEQENLINFL